MQPEVRMAMGWSVWVPEAVTASLILSLLLVSSERSAWAVCHDNSSVVDFSDLPELFGVPLNPEGVQGCLTEVTKPANTCHLSAANGSLDTIVLLPRSGCTFDPKAIPMHRASFNAALAHDVDPQALVCMAPVCQDLRRQRVIPSVFVGKATSQDLRVLVRCDKLAHVLLLPDATPCPELDCHPTLAVYWVLGRTLALVASTLFVSRRLWLWLRAWWGQGTAEKPHACQKAQVRTFTRLSDLCAICLDDYEEGDQLKILPCSHVYHCRCIDPWFLHATQRSCPLCKQSVASTQDGSTIDSVRDDERSLTSHQPPIWAMQARLRSRRLELLARASPQHRCSATSLAVAGNVASSNRSLGPS